MPDTLTPPPETALVWIRAQIPEPLHTALQKLQAQAFVDSGKRQNFEDTLITVLEAGKKALTQPAE
ncbi:hypothetical protein Q5H92_08795 [Hymenobacter sp. M29]|uniref:Uncharacterized protein n=1 Tax=Hymenobacter mellowenesis TaxID=3063995 RepID=A0ABT9AAK9_9BACT|nr:hypothetical protein [Hymenobacter sp. M29]MDO7846452.1 hypothetical protein [Hymenobacter sp. M29]